MTPIVLFTGLARSGKDTAAKALAQKFGGTVIAFADPIKEFLHVAYELTQEQLYGVDKEKEFDFNMVDDYGELGKAVCRTLVHRYEIRDAPHLLTVDSIDEWQRRLPARITPRTLMQSFGTECVRHDCRLPNFWLEHGLITAQAKLAEGANVVCITDGRFRNEVLGVKLIGGLCVRIERVGAQQGLSEEARKHVSETEQASMPDWWFDATLANGHTVETFQSRVCEWFGEAFKRYSTT